jgi:hypothetical protein
MPHDVIMPALGMAQDTGKLLTWLKAPGDAVAADDPLFEVETDKAAMEVAAGHDGYLAATLAEEGQDVAVGDVIAVISAAKPDAPQAHRAGAAAAAQPEAAAQSAPKPAAPVSAKTAAPAKQAPPVQAGGRILASPKARRLAAERGLDLARLADAGHPQPYHVADLEALAALPTATAAAGATAGARDSVSARLPAGGFVAFCDWIAAETGAPAWPDAILAAFAAGAMRAAQSVEGALALQVGGLSGSVTYVDPDLAPLSQLAPVETQAPALIVRDLRGSRISGARFGADTAPVLSLTADDAAIEITLDAPAGLLTPDQALALVSGFTARLEEPLHHLL